MLVSYIKFSDRDRGRDRKCHTKLLIDNQGKAELISSSINYTLTIQTTNKQPPVFPPGDIFKETIEQGGVLFTLHEINQTR